MFKIQIILLYLNIKITHIILCSIIFQIYILDLKISQFNNLHYSFLLLLIYEGRCDTNILCYVKAN
jgi:hypothetical protein